VAGHRGRPGGVRDLLIYVAIGLGLVLGVIVFEIHQAKTGGAPDLPLKWMGFGVESLVLFGYVFRRFRRHWQEARYWSLLSIFAAAHFLLGYAILVRIEAVPVLYFGLVLAPEFMLLSACLEHSLRRGLD
jgi:hypothetical protein